MPPVVVHEAEFWLPHLTTPLDGLGNGADGCYGAVGGVGVGSGDVAGGAEELTDVLGEVEAVGVPCAVLLDSQRAGGDGLRGVPRNEPEAGMGGAGEVAAGNLQVASVQIAPVERYCAVDGYFLEAAAPHAVIGAGDHGADGFIAEADGAVFCVVDGSPNAGFGLDARLITVGIEDGREAEACFILRAGDVRVLVKRVSLIEGVIACLHRHTAVANVVVVIAVGFTIHLSACELGAGVVHEGIVHHVTLAGSRASGGTAEHIVGVFTLYHKGASSVVGHAGEQVSLSFVRLREHHAVGLGELVQQVAALQVLIAELLITYIPEKSASLHYVNVRLKN